MMAVRWQDFNALRLPQKDIHLIGGKMSIAAAKFFCPPLFSA
jgi:hypothetical protein